MARGAHTSLPSPIERAPINYTHPWSKSSAASWFLGELCRSDNPCVPSLLCIICIAFDQFPFDESPLSQHCMYIARACCSIRSIIRPFSTWLLVRCRVSSLYQLTLSNSPAFYGLSILFIGKSRGASDHSMLRQPSTSIVTLSQMLPSNNNTFQTIFSRVITANSSCRISSRYIRLWKTWFYQTKCNLQYTLMAMLHRLLFFQLSMTGLAQLFRSRNSWRFKLTIKYHYCIQYCAPNVTPNQMLLFLQTLNFHFMTKLNYAFTNQMKSRAYDQKNLFIYQANLYGNARQSKKKNKKWWKKKKVFERMGYARSM